MALSASFAASFPEMASLSSADCGPDPKRPRRADQADQSGINDPGLANLEDDSTSHTKIGPPEVVTSSLSSASGQDSGFSDGATGEESQESFIAQQQQLQHPQQDQHQNNGVVLDCDQPSTSYGLPSNYGDGGAVVLPSGPLQQPQPDEDEDDDNASMLSGFSDMSGAEWKPNGGPFSWVRALMMKDADLSMLGLDPRMILSEMFGEDIKTGFDNAMLWELIKSLVSEAPAREKLQFVNTLDNVVELIKASKNVLVLTGAGVSVSCGIPDFRSRDGVYARLAVDFPDLPNPESMFDIHYFRRDPRPFFKFAREIYPGQFKPSPCHRFIRNLEKQNKLLRNYTQNIDTLEQVAGLERVVQCHGSFATATCTKCSHKVKSDDIKEEIFAQRIPYCPVCIERIANQPPLPPTIPLPPFSQAASAPSVSLPPTAATTFTPSTSAAQESSSAAAAAERLGESATQEGGSTAASTNSEEAPAGLLPSGIPVGSEAVPPSVPPVAPTPGIMKPDIVFFGEGLGDEFHSSVAKDKNECDLLIMIGSSLKVRPVALIPSSISTSVPQILINRENLPHLNPDVELLGNCDEIVNQLSHMLGEGWEDAKHKDVLEETLELLPPPPPPPESEPVEASASSNPGSGTTAAVEAASAAPVDPHCPMSSVSAHSEDAQDVPPPPHSSPPRVSEETAATQEQEQKPSENVDEQSKPNQDEEAPNPGSPAAAAANGDPENDDSSDDEDDSGPGWDSSKPRISLSTRLPAGQYYFQPPSRYVFPGAEVYGQDPEEDLEPRGETLFEFARRVITKPRGGVDDEDDSGPDENEGSSEENNPRQQQPGGAEENNFSHPQDSNGSYSSPPYPDQNGSCFASQSSNPENESFSNHNGQQEDSNSAGGSSSSSLPGPVVQATSSSSAAPPPAISAQLSASD